MFAILRSCLQIRFRKCNLTSRAFISQNYIQKQSVSPQTFQSHESKKIGPLGWFLLIIPGSTFALGTWQVKRKKWKENLLVDLKTRTNTDPIELPTSMEEIRKLEYYPVHVRGCFLHDKEIHLGPRSLMKGGDAASSSSLFSKQQHASQGYLIVTPFKLADRDTYLFPFSILIHILYSAISFLVPTKAQTILINRGWVSYKQKDPRTRVSGQVQGDVDIIGVVRLQENRPPFMPANKPEGNSWFYRDLSQMCEVTGADPIFLDATDDFDVKGGPIGGQTRVSLRNEHLSYILTWYSLCAVTSFMWYSQFIKGVRF